MSDHRPIEQLRRRVARNPASVSFAALAEEYRRAGEYREAIATCRAGLTRHPAYVPPRLTLAQALLAVGQFQDARRELAHVLFIDPENPIARALLADVQEDRVLMAPDAGEGRAGALTETDRRALAALERFLAAIRRVRGADARRGRGAVDLR